MSIAVLPVDEGMHEALSAQNFSESMYFNFVDAQAGIAGLFRIGNRPNEGTVEKTAIVFLDDGSAAVSIERITSADFDRFQGGGLTLRVPEPLAQSDVHYSGSMSLLASGTLLEDPKGAFSTSARAAVSVDLDYQNLGPMYGMSPSGQAEGGLAGGSEDIALGHYEGPCAVSGAVRIADRECAVSCYGFRDHSWGPRNWEGPLYWRLYFCMVDEKNGFSAFMHKAPGGSSPGHGLLLRDGQRYAIDSFDVESTYGPAPFYVESARLVLHAGGLDVPVDLRVEHRVPLRHRRAGRVARILESVCEYHMEGHIGAGLAEYHDRIEDGTPAGASEA